MSKELWTMESSMKQTFLLILLVISIVTLEEAQMKAEVLPGMFSILVQGKYRGVQRNKQLSLCLPQKQNTS